MADHIEFLGCPEYEIDAGDSGDFLWLELSVAADHGHKGIRIRGARTAHGIAAFGVRVVGDTAGVDDHHIRAVVHGHARIPRLVKQPC